MRTLVFLLEELSAKDLLQGVLPKIVPETIDVKYIVFEGKSDLERSLAAKLRGWRLPETAFVILRDQDAGDCRVIKERLVVLAREVRQSNVVVRIACRALESWILGDWPAVAKGFNRAALIAQSKKAVYRVPDDLVSPVTELRKFIPTYQKRDGARRVGPHMTIKENQSVSFRVFCQGVHRLVAGTFRETA